MKHSYLLIAFLGIIACSASSVKNYDSARENGPSSVHRVPNNFVDFSKEQDFHWCVATAAHQIEGNNLDSDHYHWEQNAQDRVITKYLVPNPAADELMKNMAGAFAPDPIPCPIFDANNDPDPERLHSKLFNGTSGKTKICEVSGKSIDVWNRIQDPNLLKEEIKLIADLHVTEYRFSVEWSRVEPKRKQFNLKALQVYADFVVALKKAGIEPQVTLFHFTMPQWLREDHGWENAKSPAYFSEFTKTVYKSLGVNVKTWYTFNEPMVHITAGYMAGVLPPGLKDTGKLPIVLANLLKAHAVSYHALHHLAQIDNNKIQVGMAHHLRIFDAASAVDDSNSGAGKLIGKELETLGAKIAGEAWNWLIFDAVETGKIVLDLKWAAPIAKKLGFKIPPYLNMQPQTIPFLKGTQDFLGVNYYTRDLIKFSPDKILPGKSQDLSQVLAPIVNPRAITEGRINDMKWEIYPEGLYRILMELQQRGLKQAIKEAPNGQLSITHDVRPIIISETGIADSADKRRKKFLMDHLVQMKRALDEGVRVKGFCHWTLVDNFEWNSGYYPQFGFYSVDLLGKDQKRTLRPSGKWFSEMIQAGGFNLEQ